MPPISRSINSCYKWPYSPLRCTAHSGQVFCETVRWLVSATSCSKVSLKIAWSYWSFLKRGSKLAPLRKSKRQLLSFFYQRRAAYEVQWCNLKLLPSLLLCCCCCCFSFWKRNYCEWRPNVELSNAIRFPAKSEYYRISHKQILTEVNWTNLPLFEQTICSFGVCRRFKTRGLTIVF